jgi:hypothetical protein
VSKRESARPSITARRKVGCMRFVAPFSAFTLREQMLSILRSQIQIAFSYIERAKRNGDHRPDGSDLITARRVYDGALSLRSQIDLDVEETEEIDRDLQRLVTAIVGATRVGLSRAG